MSNVKFAARVTNFAEAAEFLDGKVERKIGYKTVVRRSVVNPRKISLIHHDTAIITWSDGDPIAYLHTNGIVSRTTANRLNYFTPDTYRIGSRITDTEMHYRISHTPGLWTDVLWHGNNVWELWLGPIPAYRRPILAGVNY